MDFKIAPIRMCKCPVCFEEYEARNANAITIQEDGKKFTYMACSNHCYYEYPKANN